MLKRMRRIDIGQQSPQQVCRTDDLARSFKGFELVGLLSYLCWQARHHFLLPIILLPIFWRDFLNRRIIVLIWHVVSPGTFLRRVFFTVPRSGLPSPFFPLFSYLISLSSRFWGLPPGPPLRSSAPQTPWYFRYIPL